MSRERDEGENPGMEFPMSLFGLWDVLTGKQVCKKG